MNEGREGARRSGGDGRSSCSQAKATARRALYGASPRVDPAVRAPGEDSAPKNPQYVSPHPSPPPLPRLNPLPSLAGLRHPSSPSTVPRTSSSRCLALAYPWVAAMSTDAAPASMRKGTAASKSKAMPTAAMGSSLPRGSSSAAAFMGRGSSSAPAPNPSGSNGVATAASIHAQLTADGFDLSSIHGRRSYPVAPSS